MNITKTKENISKIAGNPVEKLEKENHALRELLVEALEKIKHLEKKPEKREPSNDDYNKAWTIVSKIVFLITRLINRCALLKYYRFFRQGSH